MKIANPFTHDPHVYYETTSLTNVGFKKTAITKVKNNYDLLMGIKHKISKSRVNITRFKLKSSSNFITYLHNDFKRVWVRIYENMLHC